MIMDVIKDAWNAAKDRLGMSSEKPTPDRDYAKDPHFQMSWDKVVDKIERAAAEIDSGDRIERVEKPDRHDQWGESDYQRTQIIKNDDDIVARSPDKPIPNPTLSRDLDQPRLSLKL